MPVMLLEECPGEIGHSWVKVRGREYSVGSQDNKKTEEGTGMPKGEHLFVMNIELPS